MRFALPLAAAVVALSCDSHTTGFGADIIPEAVGAVVQVGPHMGSCRVQWEGYSLNPKARFEYEVGPFYSIRSQGSFIHDTVVSWDDSTETTFWVDWTLLDTVPDVGIWVARDSARVVNCTMPLDPTPYPRQK
jgi:hypothetical protein